MTELRVQGEVTNIEDGSGTWVRSETGIRDMKIKRWRPRALWLM
jgi:hypothetical protein